MHGIWGAEPQERPPGGGPGWREGVGGTGAGRFWEWEPRQPGLSPAPTVSHGPTSARHSSSHQTPHSCTCPGAPGPAAPPCPDSRAWASWRRWQRRYWLGEAPRSPCPPHPPSTPVCMQHGMPVGGHACRRACGQLRGEARHCLTAGEARMPGRGVSGGRHRAPGVSGLGPELREEAELAPQDRQVLCPPSLTRGDWPHGCGRTCHWPDCAGTRGARLLAPAPGPPPPRPAPETCPISAGGCTLPAMGVRGLWPWASCRRGGGVLGILTLSQPFSTHPILPCLCPWGHEGGGSDGRVQGCLWVVRVSV